jgi:tetratricopeptide (TPR) repeat protein
VETDRIALIRYTAHDGTSCVGSGLLVGASSVLTADHVADGQGYSVECAGQSREVSQVLRSGTLDVDLAVVMIAEPVNGIEWLRYARVDRNHFGRVDGCVAVGFPRWKKDGDQRRSAQVEGMIPTAEGLEETADAGLRAGFLTLVGNRAPEAPRVPAGTMTEGKRATPWSGMSGAGVIAGNFVIGVVRSHNIAAGAQSLTVTPLTAIENLPEEKQQGFWKALGVVSPRALPSLPTARRDEAPAESTSHPPVRTLPRDIPDFTGRGAEVAYVLDALRPGSGGGQSVAIHAVDGMAGIGKTSLAVHIGYKLASRYPDALFLDLRAHTEGRPPMDPGEALEHLLIMLGIPVERILPNFDQRVAQWRTELAMRQAVVILDNAVSAEQVQPLLPGTSDSLVVITSRTRLMGLDGVVSLSLDTMKPVDAIELFTRIIGSDRVKAQPGPVAAAAIRCGYLPLAIRLVASWLSRHPTKSVNYVLERLAGPLNPVSTAFELSYRDLNDEQQLVFRRLGLHPGQIITPEAAAELAGMDQVRTQMILDELHDRHLIEESPGDRYRFHDLIREYARNLARDHDSEPDRGEAVTRLIDHYLIAIKHNQMNYNYKWFDDEMPELLACAFHATEHGKAEYAWRLSRALALVMQVRGLLPQARRLHSAGLEAAYADGDKRTQAAFHIDLSILDRHNDDRPGALHHSREALRLYQDVGEEFSQASAMAEMGVIFREIGEYQSARDYLNQAMRLYVKYRNGIGEGNVAGALGDLAREAGDYREAREFFTQALNLYIESNELLGAANANYSLGELSNLIGDHADALNYFDAALTFQRRLGNRSAQADILTCLGDIKNRVGDLSGALRNWKLAHSIYAEIASQAIGSIAERIGKVNSEIEP